MCLALEKGRASDIKVLNVCRRFGALCLACSIRPRVRWIPSEINPSDHDSRLWEAFVSHQSFANHGDVSASSVVHVRGDGQTGSKSCCVATVEPSVSNRVSSIVVQYSGSGSRGSEVAAEVRGETTNNSEVGEKIQFDTDAAQNASSSGEGPEGAHSESCGTSFGCSRHVYQSQPRDSKTFYDDNARGRQRAHDLSKLGREAEHRTAIFDDPRTLRRPLYVLPSPQGGLQLCDDLQTKILEYFDHEFVQGSTVEKGSQLVAAICHFHPGYTRALHNGVLVGVSRAVQGWNRVAPTAARNAIPECLVDGVANDLMRRRKTEHAIRTIFAHEQYLRPGEAAQILMKHVHPPNASYGRGGEFWCLELHAFEDGVSSKTNRYDDALLLDGPISRWIGPILAQLKKSRSPAENLFRESVENWGKEFQIALKNLCYEKVSLYSLRHSGPSADALDRRRSLQDIKKRGRWVSDTSVRRYEKSAKLLTLTKKMSPALLQHCVNCLSRIPRIMLERELPLPSIV